MAVPNIISGNLTASILDHLPQFIVAPNIFLMHLTLNPIIMKETGQDLIKKILYLIISQLTGIIFCFHLTQTLKNPIKLSLCTSKKFFLNKLKFKDKLWITPGLQKSLYIKNQFLSKYIKLKDPCKKKEAHIRVNGKKMDIKMV